MNNSRDNEEEKRYPKMPPKKMSPALRKRNDMWKFESPYMEGRRDQNSMDYAPEMRPPSSYYMDRRSRPGSRWGRQWDPYPHDSDWWHGPPRRHERINNRPPDFHRRRPNPVERIHKWETPSGGRPPLQLEDEFKNVSMPVRNQLFKESNSNRRREIEESNRPRNHLNMDLLERELETEMMEDRRRHRLEMDRRQYYMPLYGPSIEDPEQLRPTRRRRMPWADNWDQMDRSYSRRGWMEDSQRDLENSSQRLPSVAKYEEMLRERERLIQSQRQKDIEIENYRKELESRGIPDPVSREKEKIKQVPQIHEMLRPRRRPIELESEVPEIKVLPRPGSKSFLSLSEEKKSKEKSSLIVRNFQEDIVPVKFKKLEINNEENPHPRVKIRYTQMNQHDKEDESESDPGKNYSRVEVKVVGDKVEVIRNDPQVIDNNHNGHGRYQRPQNEGGFQVEDEHEEIGEHILRPKRLKSVEKKSYNQDIDINNEQSQDKKDDANGASGEFRMKIAKKSGAIRITENQPQVSSSLKNINNIGQRSLSLDDIKLDKILGHKGMLDKSTQTKDNPVIKFLGQHSLNKLSTLLKKQPEMTESQMLYISQKRGKGRPHKNKENAPFHCLLNKDKETIITEELDNIISSFVVCSLQDKQVSLKIKDFSFWMKNRLFEVISTSETFENQSLNLMDMSPDFLKNISSKLLDKCFDQKLVNLLPDFRGVFMLDFLIYNTIKTRLITETVSLNFNTLNRLRNSQELTLPLVLASFLFLVSNFLIPSKFEMFYTYSCFLFSTLFQNTISSCILHLSGRSTQLEFSIQKLVVAASTAQEDIENAYQKFISGGAPFNSNELKSFIESEKQLQFNSLLVHYIGIFAMLLE